MTLMMRCHRPGDHLRYDYRIAALQQARRVVPGRCGCHHRRPAPRRGLAAAAWFGWTGDPVATSSRLNDWGVRRLLGGGVVLHRITGFAVVTNC
jgi:hypothetical protein